MRDYLIMAIVLACMPIGLFRPYYGVLIYAWISYMNPHLLAWSFGRTLPIAKLAGLGVLIGTVLHRSGDTRPLRQRENVLMILLFIIFTISSFFAIHPERAWEEWQNMAKIILMALVTSSMLTDQKRLRYFLLVVAFSLGFWGVKGGLFSLVTGGNQMVLGPSAGSIIGANNALGVALNMCLPLFWFMAKEEKSRWLKRILQLSFLLIIPAIMFTYSRASALGLAAVLLGIILKGKKKILFLGFALLVGLFAIEYMPDKWLKRQQSTVEYKSDTSAMSRLGEWEFCWRLALDRPLTGGGFEFYSPETYKHYFPEFLLEFGGRSWNSHSIYYGLLAAHGFPGLFVFLCMIGLSLLSLQSIKARARSRPDLSWLGNYSDMIQISYLGFLVNGAFNNMEYFDLVYHWVGVVACLKVLAAQELSTSPATEQTPAHDVDILPYTPGTVGGAGQVPVR